MPTYDYKCEKGHEFEAKQKITAKPIKYCRVSCCDDPNMSCGYRASTCGAPCHRQLGPTSFHLKGSGWAKDGYSSAGKKEKK